ncbi:hypothetical protein [Maioricimonas sp. JC845]|uniref:hypothetical protein n=1 Tax=Maioricimonas sp. JC845 TaxID=3232138 RepID=UPI00345A118A
MALPSRLLELIVQNVGEERFDADALQREQQLAQMAPVERGIVGFWRGRHISYPFLSPRQPLVFNQQAADILKRSIGNLASIAADYNRRSEQLDLPRRGYLGWLLTNRQFLEEHDVLVDRHRQRLETYGFPAATPSSCSKQQPARINDTAWVHEFRKFFERWRLQGLDAPHLPRPLAPRLPDLFANAPAGVCSTSLPDIYPTLGRGAMDECLEDALRGAGQPPHLAGWMEIVEKDNPAKNRIGKLARQFRLQHFWRILHQRHDTALSRRRKALRHCFAEFLNVSEDTVRSDLREIECCLGPDGSRGSTPSG